jgi:hypothetical protein
MVFSQENIPASEMNALWSLYNSTDGANWVWYDAAYPQYFEGAVWNFTPSANPCTDQWQGIVCNSSDTANYSYVANLTLASHALRGYIPTEIAQLTQLQVLDLSENELSGSIPTEIGQLTQLWVLDFGANKLTGAIRRTSDSSRSFNSCTSATTSYRTEFQQKSASICSFDR